MGADNIFTSSAANVVHRGDFSVTLAGNMFNATDRDFFLEVLEVCKRRGFNRYVDTVAITHFGIDPRTKSDGPETK